MNKDIDYKVHVTDLDPDTTRQDLETFFGRYGTVKRVWPMMGYVYVEFKHRRHANDAARDKDQQ